MNWTLISVLVCLVLCVKLMFFTDQHRSESRWFHRVVLFLSAVYAGKQVIWFLYHPSEPVSPWLTLFHLTMLVGAFMIKPRFLPWNHYR